MYSKIQSNPTIENVKDGVNAFKKSGADYVVAIGTAKVIAIIITNLEFEDVRSLEGLAPTKNACAPILQFQQHREQWLKLQ